MRQLIYLIAVTLLTPPFASLAQTLESLGEFFPHALSSDGSVVVGRGLLDQPVRWKDGEATNLAEWGVASDVSADGRVIVGMTGSETDERPCKWTDGFLRLLPLPPAGPDDSAATFFRSLAISHDGSIIYGQAGITGPIVVPGWEIFSPIRSFSIVPVRWQDNGFRLLEGESDTDRRFVATDASGKIAVGSAKVRSDWRAMQWRDNTFSLIGPSTGVAWSSADHLSRGGAKIVINATYKDTLTEAFHVYDAATGSMTEAVEGYARSISGDGTMVVGTFPFPRKGFFIWTADEGQRDLETFLTESHGLDLGGWEFGSFLVQISDDGKVIVGNGTSPAGKSGCWRARLTDDPTLSVNSTADRGLKEDAKGCDTGETTDSGSRECTLRAAIEWAAIKSDMATSVPISFSIPGDGVPTIKLTKALPPIGVPMKIDGTTQSAGMVEIDGNNLNSAGLNLQAGKSEVRGLIFHSFVGTHGTGIRIASNSENVVAGNFFGVDASGNIPKKLSRGILIDRSASNVIGGTEAGAENIIWATNIGIQIKGEGSNANRVIGNRIGLGKSGDGLINSTGTRFIDGTGIRIDQGDRNEIGGSGKAGNLIAGDVGIFFAGEHAVTGTKIIGNRIGLDATGKTIVGGELGIFGFGSPTTPLSNTEIRSNQIAGHLLADIWLLGEGSRKAMIAGNTIGLRFDGSGELPTAPEDARSAAGIRLDSGLEHTVENNVIAGQAWNLVVSGSIMAEYSPPVDADNDGIPEDEGGLTLYWPNDDEASDEDLTNLREVTIQGNTLGLNKENKVPVGAKQLAGLSFFGYARKVTATSNIIAGHELAEVMIIDGDGHALSGNTIGSPDGTGRNSHIGVLLKDPVKTTIGPNNVIGRNETVGIHLIGEIADLTIEGNKIGTDLTGKTAWPNQHGIQLSPDSDTDEVRIENNLISGNTGSGILLGVANEFTISRNRIGVTAGGGPLANGIGVNVLKGTVDLTSNTIAHNRLAGITIKDGSLSARGNPIYDNGEGLGMTGIVYEKVPHSAPRELAALRTVPDASGKVTVVFALPKLGANTATNDMPVIPGEPAVVEFFANHGPSDTQGRVPLFKRTIDPTEPWSEKFVVGNDSAMATMSTFTATITRRGRTSPFSTHAMSEAIVWPEPSFGPTGDPDKLTITWPNPGKENLFILKEMMARDPSNTGASIWTESEHRATLNNGLMTVTIPVTEGDQLFRLELNPSSLF